jgi:outer membrane receptor protein involved in Fe transport
LAEALEELRNEGLEIFFTSRVVGPELRVAEEPDAEDSNAEDPNAEAPDAEDLRERLRRLLEPHGLEAVEGPGGRLVVVRREEAPATLRGTVRDRGTGEPVPGVRLFLPGTEHRTWSAADGSYELAGLAPGRHPLEAHLPGFVVQQLEVEVAPGEVTEKLLDLDAIPLSLDEIVITPSSISLLGEDPVTGLALDREDLATLPHLSDDLFRALTLLPGVTGEEVSARFSVRGGHADEVLVLLDQIELYEPYHLKDYSSSLSIIAPRALREVQLLTGGFPARYGDRMSGVLDMTTVEPRKVRTHVGLSLLSLELGSSGAFDGERGHWFTSARRGSLLLTLDFLGRNEKPRYWDALGKVDYQLTERQRLGLSALHSEDRLDYFNIDPDTVEDYRTGYRNSYVWMPHQILLGSRWLVETALYGGEVKRDRRGLEAEPEADDGIEGEEDEGEEDEEEAFTILDRRRLEVSGIKQDWSFEAARRLTLRWGFEGRRMDTDYDYFNHRQLDDPLAEIRTEPRTGTVRLDRRLEGEQTSAYVSARSRPRDDLALELGLRFDEHTLTRDRHFSPRVNLLYAPDTDTAWRAAWGYFYQSQRPYELQVEDGITTLATAERTEQRVLGLERRFHFGASGRPLLLRLEAYQRKITDPRPRYENIYEPISIFPEIEPDRVLIAPQSSEAWGIELFLRGSLGRHDWWVSYGYSRIEDRIASAGAPRSVPRRFDQPHALTLDLNLRPGRDWNLNFAWRYHTGWPTTAVSGRLEEDDEGEMEVVPVFGPRNGERLPPYHRLDLRASREWRLGWGTVGFFVEIQNLYDRENTAGFDVDFEFLVDEQGQVQVLALEEPWGGFLPSFGLTFDF